MKLVYCAVTWYLLNQCNKHGLLLEEKTSCAPWTYCMSQGDSWVQSMSRHGGLACPWRSVQRRQLHCQTDCRPDPWRCTKCSAVLISCHNTQTLKYSTVVQNSSEGIQPLCCCCNESWLQVALCLWSASITIWHEYQLPTSTCSMPC